MLSPDDQSTLLELLEPPTGFELDVAVGFTYTLDLNALLTLPTAFAIGGALSSDEVESEPQTPLELLDALRTYASKITVFCDAGRIVLPAKARSGVFSFLEQSVVPVRAPRGGAFHPKVWVIRFTNGHGRSLHRAIVASRNLTFDRSWDTVISLDECGPSESGQTLEIESLLGACIDGSIAVAPIREQQRKRVAALKKTIREVRFALPAGFESMKLHTSGIKSGEDDAWPFPPKGKRLLVVSPFLKQGLLQELPGGWAETTIVSRGDEIDRELGGIFGGAGVEPSETPTLRTINSSLVDAEPESGGALTGLHAKLFVVDEPLGVSRVYSGSANATNAAFKSNVEAFIEFVGKTDNVGVSTFIGDDGIAPLLTPHSWGAVSDADEEDQSTVLDRVRNALVSVELTANVSPRPDGRFDVRYWQEAHPGKALGAEGVRISLRPITMSGWTDSACDPPLDVTFPVAEMAITAFLGVRLQLGSDEQTFLLVGQLVGLPEGRDDRTIAALLGSPERLIRYLMLLLVDPTQDRFDGGVRKALEREQGHTSTSLSTVPLMEVMAKALLGDGSRLAKVDRLIAAVSEQPGLVDPQLTELWAAIRKAAKLKRAAS